MPRVTMPDGTSYRIDAPEGMSNEEIANVATQHWKSERESAAASAVMGSAGGSGAGGGSLDVTGLAGSALTGITRSLAGIGKAELEIPGVSWAASHLLPGPSVSAADVPAAQKKVEEALPRDPSLAGSAAQFGGEMAPYMMVPGGAMTQGAVAGGTSLDADGLVDRLVGAGLGALGGKVLDLTGSAIAKVANAAGLEGKINAAKKMFMDLSPASAPLKGKINNAIERKWQRFGDLSRMATDEGDKMGTLDVSGLKTKADDLVTEAGKVSGQDTGAMKLLRDTQRVLSEDTKRPDKLMVSGTRFDRDPISGEYKSSTGEVLNEKVVKAAIPDDAGPPDIKYKNLQAMKENLDQFLDKKGDLSNDAVRKVKEMRAAIESRLGEVRTPQVDALEKKAKSYYDKELGKYDKDVMQRILGAKDPLERAQIVLNDVAKNTKVDPGVAGDVADMLGESGRRSVSTHMMHGAIIDATGKDGRVDPVKFLHYFDDKPGFEPFKAQHFDEVAKGFSSYIKQQAALRGESRVPSISNVGRHATSAAIAGSHIVSSLAKGDMTGIVTAMGMYLGSNLTLGLADKALEDSFLRHLLIVGGRLPEGSPRWQRVMGQISARFTGPAAGMAGQLGSDVTTQLTGQ